MAHFHIARIALNPNQAMYDELIAALSAGFTELGHVCTSSVNETVEGAITLLVGTTIMGATLLRLRSRLRGIPYIVYQLEQLDDAHGMLPDYPDYRDLLDDADAIWDYAPSTTAYLLGRGHENVSPLPLSYHSCLKSFHPAANPDLDILLVGTPNPRRTEILEALGQTGAKVGLANGLYGAERDAVIARAKILLNIHGWDRLATLETIRLSHLLANRCFIISESGDHDPYDGGVIYADYPALIQTCLGWLDRPASERDAVVERGYSALRRTSMTERMGAAIAALGDLDKYASPRSASLIWPGSISGAEEAVLAHWCREGSGEGGVLLAGDLPARLVPLMAGASSEAGRLGLISQGKAIRLLILGGRSSYQACRAQLERWLPLVENYGAFAILGVGTEPGASQLHAETLAYNEAVREVHAVGSLRLFGSVRYSAANTSSVERMRAIRGSSFLIE
jgi:hypothetical protein